MDLAQQESRSKEKSQNEFIYPFIHKNKFKWQFLLFIVLNYYLIEAPLASTFYQIYLHSQNQFIPWNIFLFLILAADYIIKFWLTYKKKARKKERLYKIIFYYAFRTWRGFDLVALIFFYMSFMIPFQAARYLRYVILVRLVDIIQFNEKIYHSLHSHPIARKIYTTFKIMYLMSLFSHYFGCWFQLIDQILIDEQYYGTTTLGNQLYYQMNMLCFTPIENLDVWGRYLYGFYFASSLITTIAYGDIIGKNQFEDIYVLFLMIISTITIGLILQQFMNLVREDSVGIYQFIKMYNCLQTKMIDSQISFRTQSRVRSYLIFTEYQKKLHTHEPVYDKLSDQLQKSINHEIFCSPLRSIFIDNMKLLKEEDLFYLANKCQIITFPAQTDVYQEIARTNLNPRSCLLIKVEGITEELIECPFSKYPGAEFTNITYKNLNKKFIHLETTNKRIFNLANIILNCNKKIQDLSDMRQDNTLQYITLQIDAQNSQSSPETMIRPFYLQPENRLLHSTKISSFFLISLEKFQELIRTISKNSTTNLVKNIRYIREQILSKEYPLAALGEFCPICIQDSDSYSQFQAYVQTGVIIDPQNMKRCQHLIQQCPMAHYIISQNQLHYSSAKKANLNNIITILDNRQQKRRQLKKDNFAQNFMPQNRSTFNNLNFRQTLSANSPNNIFNLIRHKRSTLFKNDNHIKERRYLRSKKIFSHHSLWIHEEQQKNLSMDELTKSQPSNIVRLFKNTISELSKKTKYNADSSYDAYGLNQKYSIAYHGNL